MTTIRRISTWTAAAVASLFVLLVSATSASAYAEPIKMGIERGQGMDPGPGLSVVETLLLYVAAPLLVVAILVLPVLAPAWARRRS